AFHSFAEIAFQNLLLFRRNFLHFGRKVCFQRALVFLEFLVELGWSFFLRFQLLRFDLLQSLCSGDDMYHGQSSLERLIGWSEANVACPCNKLTESFPPR